MTGNIEKSTLLLSVGIILGSLILAVSIQVNTSKLSRSLVTAGERSQSNHSTSFPTDLRIQMSETSMDLPPEKKTKLRSAFVKACVGQVYDNKTVKEVTIIEFKVKYWGSNLDFTGDIVFEDGSIHEGYESHLYRDGFGGYEGFVRTKNGSRLIIKDINIR